MIGHHVRFAGRQFARNATYSTLTVAGLAIGIASCLLIFLHVQSEISYDGFHRKGDRIYRLNKVVTPRTGGTERHAISSGPMGPALETDFAEVEATVRVLPWFDEVLVRYADQVLKTPDFVFADSAFFQVFDFGLVRGDPTRVLAAPMSTVITESAARALFGDEDPVGQQVTGLNDLQYTITGIAADPPSRSHLGFDFVVAYSSLESGRGGLEMDWLASWFPQALFTYVVLQPRASAEALRSKLDDFMLRHFPERADQYTLYLQPLSDIHLGSEDLLFTGRTRSGSRFYVRVLSLVALLILLIAAINFTNMGTARATRRAREIGVRKAVGAGRRELARQFLLENLVVAAVGLAIALVIVQVTLPILRAVTGSGLPFGVWTNWPLVIFTVAIWVVVGVGAGAYPAFHLSRLRSVTALRGSSSGAPSGGRLRRVLVTVQFAVSIVLIAGTLLVLRQTRYMMSRDLGFDKDQIILLDIGSTDISERSEAFRDELSRIPGVVSIAGSNSVPGRSMMSFGINPEGKAQDETWTSAAYRLDDFNLMETYGMDMRAGRWFSDDRPADRIGSVVVNEALVRSLGWTADEAVGRRMDVGGEVERGTVIGVVRDFHVESLKRPIQPLLMYYAPRDAMLSVRLRADDLAATIASVEGVWTRFDPVYPFEYAFLDREFAALYASEERLSNALGLFAMLAVVVACLGLLGLAAFAAEQRTKEIGIRKVLGASVPVLVALLTRETLRLVLVAAMIAAPLAWLAGNRWMSGFAYRSGGTGWMIAAAAIATLLLALGTVSWQAWRAAAADPVRSLRYE